MKKLLSAAAALLLSCTAAWAQTPPPAELERALTGRWQGHLEYRDYQSDRRVRIPLQSELRLGSDGATLTRESRFDDGPARGTVLITTVSLYDEAGSRVTAASFRRGRAVETSTETARVIDHAGATQWTAEWQRRGLDGGVDSDIRTTLTRRGDEMRAVKEVRAAGAETAAWAFRNETVLKRVP
jgi:hypothetical protein